MKIDCKIHEENQCIFICVSQKCTSECRFLCQECITEQNEKHNHSMVSLTSLSKMDQSAQFKLLSFADTKKTFLSNLKLHNTDEKVSKITSFYDRLSTQLQEIIENKKQIEIQDCQLTACSSFSLLKQSRIEELVNILNKTTSSSDYNQNQLNQNVQDFFTEYHKDSIQVEKFLNNCIQWDQKFSYVDDEQNKKFNEIIFKVQSQLEKLSPQQNKMKSSLSLEIANCIKNEEILLPEAIEFNKVKSTFTKTGGQFKHFIGIIDIPITRDLLKTSFKVKIHNTKWVGVGVCDRDIVVHRDYQGEFKLLSSKNGIWVATSNGHSFGSEQESDCQSKESFVYFHKDDVLVVTPYDYKIEYYSEARPDRVFSQPFTYDDNRIYCPCFTFWDINNDEIEFIQ